MFTRSSALLLQMIWRFTSLSASVSCLPIVDVKALRNTVDMHKIPCAIYINNISHVFERKDILCFVTL